MCANSCVGSSDHRLTLHASGSLVDASIQTLLDNYLATDDTGCGNVMTCSNCLMIERCGAHGDVPNTEITVEQSVAFPLPSSQVVMNLCAVVAIGGDSDTTIYTKGRNLRGHPIWFSFSRSSWVEVGALPVCNCILAVYESDQVDSGTPWELLRQDWAHGDQEHAAVGDEEVCYPEGCVGEDMSDVESLGSDVGECEIGYVDEEDAAVVSGECEDAIDEGCISGVPYKKNAMEFVAETSSHCTGGVHILLCTLAELNAGKVRSNWVTDFVSCFSSRLPTTLSGTDYVEAYMNVCHFPFLDLDNHHVPGCMPLYLYNHVGGRKDFIPLQRYLQEVMSDPFSTRQFDEQWVSFGFSALLNSLANIDRRLPVVRRGLGKALEHPESQEEYAERFGEHILPEVLYDTNQAKVHVNELCAAIKEYNWPTYFHTQTVNMRFFPGVSDIYNAIKARNLDVRHYLGILNRTWHR